MKEDIKNLWVEALRSGKYKQSKNRLKTDDGYCCLGVLCEISNLDTFIKPLECDYYVYFKNFTMPNLLVRQWAGLKEDSQYLDKDPLEILAQLNDRDGYSFNQIADYIENSWKDL